MNGFQAGDAVMILLGRKRFVMRLQQGRLQHTHEGLIRHDELIGQPPGIKLTTHIGKPFVALRPSLHDLIMSIQRISQIIYPKELGYILLKLNVGPGARVAECGTGSGSLTLALAHMVRPSGRVYSYDKRADMIAVASKNLDNAGLLEHVEFRERDIEEGFVETDLDAVFLDVRTPWECLGQAWAALAEGGFLGAIVPTTNQVSELIAGLEARGFQDIEVCELLLRSYKPVAERLRPVDRMVAHTGFLIFARRLSDGVAPGDLGCASSLAEDETRDSLSLAGPIESADSQGV